MDCAPGDRIRVKKEQTVYEGIVMPAATDTLVIKLDNGYNIGIDPSEAEIKIIKEGTGNIQTESIEGETSIVTGENLPLVSIISTGGTIASKVDYRTGAVTSQFTAEDILEAIPELREIASYRAQVLYSILSENMTPQNWIELARKTAEEIKNGAEGIIITHGTDTMGYTAAALSFMLETPVPIVLVGSQRSADRPSSDNAMNAIGAAAVATGDIAEVTVVMHATTSDTYCNIHRGTRVRKMHTSRRDAFRSINVNPIGRVDYNTRKIETDEEYNARGSRELRLNDHLEPMCAMAKFYPGSDPGIIDHYVERSYKGLVIEGTGLGHVSTEWFSSIENAVGNGIPVVMTSQCLYGRVCDRVYDTGRDLLDLGVIEGEDMLPETALVKLMWTLGKTADMDEIKNIMQSNIAGEISRRTINIEEE